MTSQSPEVKALASCSFAPATFTKRFVRDISSMAPDVELTVRQERCLWRMLYIFRRQCPKDIAAEALRRKVNHKWERDKPTLPFRCAVCRQFLASARQNNAPCPGPPEPPKTPRKRRATAEEAHSPLLESPIVAPNLFEEMA